MSAEGVSGGRSGVTSARRPNWFNYFVRPIRRSWLWCADVIYLPFAGTFDGRRVVAYCTLRTPAGQPGGRGWQPRLGCGLPDATEFSGGPWPTSPGGGVPLLVGQSDTSAPAAGLRREQWNCLCVGRAGGPARRSKSIPSQLPSEGNAMAAYVTLYNFTEQGLRNIKDTLKRAEAVKLCAPLPPRRWRKFWTRLVSCSARRSDAPQKLWD
jgi:hypothetical protein